MQAPSGIESNAAKTAGKATSRAAKSAIPVNEGGSYANSTWSSTFKLKATTASGHVRTSIIVCLAGVIAQKVKVMKRLLLAAAQAAPLLASQWRLSEAGCAGMHCSCDCSMLAILCLCSVALGTSVESMHATSCTLHAPRACATR